MEYKYKSAEDLLLLLKSRNMKGIEKGNKEIYQKNINTI